MEILKKLTELNEEELKALFRKNQHLQEQIIDICNEDASRHFDDLVWYFQHKNPITGKTYHSAHFDTDNYNNCYVKGYDYSEFLDDLTKLNKDYEFLSEKAKSLLPRLLSRAEFVNDLINDYVETSPANYDNLTTWFEDGVELLEKETGRFITDQIESFTSSENLENQIIFEVLEDTNHIFDDYQTDGEKVYFTVNYCKG